MPTNLIVSNFWSMKITPMWFSALVGRKIAIFISFGLLLAYLGVPHQINWLSFPFITVFAEKKIPYTIVLEGNVGAGKSTFVDIISRNDSRISAFPEPVEAWQNVSGTGVNMLDLMFKDGKRWSGTFQLVSTLSRYVYFIR